MTEPNHTKQTEQPQQGCGCGRDHQDEDDYEDDYLVYAEFKLANHKPIHGLITQSEVVYPAALRSPLSDW